VKISLCVFKFHSLKFEIMMDVFVQRLCSCERELYNLVYEYGRRQAREHFTKVLESWGGMPLIQHTVL
jgi:hypothetical protein